MLSALDLSPYRSSADTLLLGSLALDAVMLACTYALTRLAVGRALRAVRTITDQATQWSAVASEERFSGIRRPAELARLGTSLDALLDRIRTVLRHERQLTGELSYELSYATEPDHRRTRLVAHPPPHGRPDPGHPQGHRGSRRVHAQHL